MTVWTFGDSFAQPYNNANQWMYRVANHLAHEHQAFGYSGSALEYTYRKFYEVRHSIKDNDIVIVSLTDSYRKWFFKDEPNTWKVYLDNSNSDLISALDGYRLHLSSNYDPLHTQLYMFLYMLNDISAQLNIKSIILANFYTEHELLEQWAAEFRYLHIAKGTLLDISCNEFKRKVKKREDFENFLAGDSRANHLIASNHIVLANKIIDYVTNNKRVDLTKGFVTAAIDEDILCDKEFIDRELFSVAWWELNKFLKREEQ